MTLSHRIKIYLTSGIIAPFVTQCNEAPKKPESEKPKPKTESLAYLAYKKRPAAQTANPDRHDLPVLFGDEWAI